MFRRLVVLVLMVVGLTMAAGAAERDDKQAAKLVLLAKPAVVRIYDGYLATAVYNSKTYDLAALGSGSGAFIDSNGYIITNAHVVTLTHDDEVARKMLFKDFAEQIARTYRITTAQFSEAGWNGVIDAFKSSLKSQKIQTVVLPNGDKFPFNFTNAFGAPAGYGKDVAIVKIEIKNAPVLKLAASEKVRIQDHVTVIGYPAAAESRILDNKSLLQSSVTDGKVSAMKNMTDGSPVFEVSAPATHGNSGGPVLNDEGEIIGLLTFGGNNVNGQEVQGFNFVIAANTVKEFVKQVGADNDGGPSDKLYREGLDYYAKGRYRSALEKFQQVGNLFPQHSEIKALIQDCEIKKSEETSSGALLVIFGAMAVFIVAALVGTLLAVMIYRSGRRKTPNFRFPDDPTLQAHFLMENRVSDFADRWPHIT